MIILNSYLQGDRLCKIKIAEKVIQSDGSWVRGNILYHQKSSPVYGIIYDAGSMGGSGYNRYIPFSLESE